MHRSFVRPAIVVAALLFAWDLPPVRAGIKAAVVVSCALGRPWPRPFRRAVRRHETTIGDAPGDLYLPRQPAPGIVLVHGAATEGKDDPRLVRLVRAIAEAHRAVFVPDLRLKARTLDEQDLDLIVSAVAALRNHPQVSGGVQLLGISYGGSFALIAAGDERIAAGIRQVATFGAYFDLVGYIQAVTTGTAIVDDQRLTWEPHPRAREVLSQVALWMVPAADRPAFGAAIDGELQPEQLPPETQALYRFVTNDKPDEAHELARRLPERAQRVLEEFSPSTAAKRIKAPVIALHSRDDPAVPYAEALRLQRALPGARLVGVELFTHVDLRGGALAAIPDLLRVWRFTSWMLSAQERGAARGS